MIKMISAAAEAQWAKDYEAFRRWLRKTENTHSYPDVLKSPYGLSLAFMAGIRRGRRLEKKSLDK